jgi:hypothetical protein
MFESDRASGWTDHAFCLFEKPERIDQQRRRGPHGRRVADNRVEAVRASRAVPSAFISRRRQLVSSAFSTSSATSSRSNGLLM